MCLILFSVNTHPDFPFILAANRDEYFNRPAQPADFWPENRNILAGKDLSSEGTWLGLNKNGRFIALTNYRDPDLIRAEAPSRGAITRRFLMDGTSTDAFIDTLSSEAKKHNGYNLLLTDDHFKTVVHYSNISDKTTIVKDGIHGLSNHLLDTPWPKIVNGKKAFERVIRQNKTVTESMMEILQDNRPAEYGQLPSTGISPELEHKLSPAFIRIPGYGTRCSTVLLLDKRKNFRLTEWTYNENSEVILKKDYQMQLK